MSDQTKAKKPDSDQAVMEAIIEALLLLPEGDRRRVLKAVAIFFGVTLHP